MNLIVEATLSIFEKLIRSILFNLRYYEFKLEGNFEGRAGSRQIGSMCSQIMAFRMVYAE